MLAWLVFGLVSLGLVPALFVVISIALAGDLSLLRENLTHHITKNYYSNNYCNYDISFIELSLVIFHLSLSFDYNS